MEGYRLKPFDTIQPCVLEPLNKNPHLKHFKTKEECEKALNSFKEATRVPTFYQKAI